MKIPITIEGINSDNYDQSGFYYTLTNNNNRVTVIVQNPTTPIGPNNNIEVTMGNNTWFKVGKIISPSTIVTYSGISGIRVNPDPSNVNDFLMQINEGALPVSYMGVG